MPRTTTVTGRYLWGDGVAVLQPPCAERADLASEAPPAQRVRVDRCAGGKTEPECGRVMWGGCSKVAEGAMVLAVGERIAVGLAICFIRVLIPQKSLPYGVDTGLRRFSYWFLREPAT